MTVIQKSTGNSNDAAQLLYGTAPQANSSKTAGTSTAAGASAALQKAEERLSHQVDKTTTLLSSLGKLKSSVADTQSAAQVLAGFSVTTTAEQMKVGIAQFVSAFNATVESSKYVSATAGGNTEVPAATRVGHDLNRVINGNNGTLADTLSKLGVSVESNGELSFDSQKFDTQQQTDNGGLAVLQKLGQVIDKITTKELSSNGAMGRSITSLHRRADVLKVRQNTLLHALQKNPSSQGKANAATSSASDVLTPRHSTSFDSMQTSTSSQVDASVSARSAALAAYMKVSRGG